MVNFAVVLCSCLAIVSSAPASNEQLDKGGNKYSRSLSITDENFKIYRKLGYYLDKATVNDVAVNTVSEEKKVEQTIQPVNGSSIVEISGITTGADAPVSSTIPVVENVPFKPQKTGSMFARLIDDIFQIPITVLQNVARLITGPFSQARKSPEIIATVS